MAEDCGGLGRLEQVDQQQVNTAQTCPLKRRCF
jgi:hypothetical protein